MISSVLRRVLFVALGLLALPAAASAQFTIQRTSSPIFFNDVGNSPSLQCMYASYEVTNTGGSSIADVWVDIGGFTGGVVGLAPTEDGVVELGGMLPGQKKTAYFYLKGATVTGISQGHTVHVYASRPPVAPALTQAFTFTSVQSTINANANKVTTVVSGPNPPQVGGIVTITVTGQTGTIGSPSMLAFSPATDLSWSATVFEMVSTQITFSGSANAGVTTDSLVFAPGSSSNTDYVAVYTLRAAGTTAAPTFVSPIGYFASGAQVKHTDTGNYGGFLPIPPPQNELTLTKSATPTYIVDGGISTYTVRLANAGLAPGTIDDVKDILPGASTIVPGSSTFNGVPIADPAVTGQTAFWYGPFAMPANGTRDLVYQVSFPATAGIFVNQAVAHVGASIIDSTLALADSLPAHAPVQIYVHNADISITKGDAPDPVGPDSLLTYTLVVSNAGPDSAFTTSAVDTLPAGVAFVSANATQGSAIETSGVVNVAIGTLAPGESSTITIQVTPSALGTLTNRAHATNARVDYVPANNTATATTTVAPPPAPDLQLVKRAAPATFTVGQVVTYTLSLSNIGTGPTQGAIALVDSLPAGLTYVSGSGPGWSVSEAGGVVTATNPGPIALGDSSLVTIQAAVTAAAFPGVRNFAQAATPLDAGAGNDSSSVSNAVVGAPDLMLAKRHTGDFSVGSPGQYTITVTNLGNLPTSAVITVRDTLPAGLGFVSGAGAGWLVNQALGIVTATNAGPIAAGDSASFTIDVSVGAAAVPFVFNTAVATTVGDVGTGNDRGVDSTFVIGFPDVQLVKRAVGAPFTVGGIATWTLTLTNVGSGATTAPIAVSDTLAAGLTYVNATGAGFGFAFADPALSATYAGALAPGDSAIVTLTAQVGLGAAPSVHNFALASTTGDTSAGNDSSSTTSAVNAAPDLRLAKRHAGDFTVGQPGQYVITLYNDGNAPTSGTITVLDTLPAGLGFVTGAGAGFAVNASGGIVTATTAGPIAAGDSASFTLDVSVGMAAAPGVVNAAVAQAPGDLNGGNDRGTDPTVVLALGPDLQVVKRALAAPFTVGGAATYELTVTNVGTAPTTGAITLTDVLAAGLTFVSGNGAGWSVTPVGQTITATNAGPIAPGDSAMVSLVVQVGALAAPSVDNTASGATPGDLTPGNDASTVTTPVNGAPDVRLVKTHAADFTVGLPGQYKITVFNDGNLPTTGTITVLDTLPAGLGFVAGTGAGWSVLESAGIVTATNPGPIAAGDSASFTLDVSVAPLAAPGVLNAAVAQAAGDVGAGNDRGVDPTVVNAAPPPAPDLQLVKRAPAAPFTVGGNAGYELTVTNVGTGPTTGGITITDTLPAGVSFVSGSGAGWTVNEALGVVTATNPGPIAAGDSALVTLTTVLGALAAPSVANSATVATAGDPNAANDTGSNTSAVNGAPDVRLVKTHAADFTVGQPGQYLITLYNDGNLPTTGTVTVLDTLPAGLGFVAGNGPGWSVLESAGIVTATNPGPIAAGDSASFTLDVSVGLAAFPAVTNTAVAQATGDVGGGNDRGVDPTVVQPAPVFPPDLQLVKRAPGAPFTVGGSATWDLSVTNVGTGPTTGGITITDALPAGMTFVSGTGSGWTVTEAFGLVTATNPGPIVALDSSLVSITATVGAAAVPSTSNSATVATLGDTNPGNDTGSNTSAVNGAPDLQLVKRHTGTFTVGSNASWTLSVTNVGTMPTTGTITVVDSLPVGTTYVSGNGFGWTFGALGQVVTATHPGPIAAGDSLQFNLTALVDVLALPSVTNVAVAQTAGDPSALNDRATDFAAINGAPDIALFKRHVGSFTVGANATYQLAVVNIGTAVTTGTITVRDTLPAGLTYVSVVGAGWSSSVSGNVVTATNPGPIAAADSATFTLTVLVGTAAYPAVQNSAVAQTPGDVGPGNDRGGDAPAPVAYLSQLALEKRAAPTIVEPADVVSYTLVLSNSGVSQVPGVVVRDTLPVGFRYADGTATVNGSPISDPAGAPGAGLAFAVGNVPANGAITLRYRALVGTSALLGDGVNRAYAENAGLNIRSNDAAARVTIQGGVFADDGILAGKVWADCDCDSNRKQGPEELGVPGVRVYLEDGRSAVTDVEGKYHFEAVAPRLHTVKVDRTTLPQGARFVTLDTRDGMSPGTRFADMKDGELFRADFALQGCDPAFVAELKARRELGEVRAAIVTAQPTVAANVDPGATRVLDGAPWAGEGDDAYMHLEPRGSLHSASSAVPDAPGTPGLLANHPPVVPTGLAISVPRRPAPADGKTLVPVTVRVPGDAPVTVTLDSNLGLWQVADMNPGVDGVQTSVSHQATFLLVAPWQPGEAIVRVTEVTDYKGAVEPATLSPVHEAEADVVFVPKARQWLVAGTLEGRYDGRSVHDADLAPGQLRDRFEDAFSVVHTDNDDGTAILGARGAMFAKGTIGDDVGVTFRFDSEHAADRRRFDDIRPDEGEAIFGDASIQGFEAQSTERLYARLDHGRSYALYGDFETDALDPIRVLGAYLRGVNGGRAHLENGRAAVDAFATHDHERQVVDEIDGRGISGPYPLSHSDGVLNSERVEVVTRDRNNPSVILSRRTMVRFADYTIEPFSGRLIFRAPVAAIDERLNPVSIRVSYELEGGGESFWTTGASAHVKPAGRVELMGNYVKEDDPIAEHQQYGAGGTVQLLARTFVTGEWAHSDSAGTIAANAYRGEVRHASDRLDLRGYGLRTDAGFDNPSSGYAGGREEWGGGAHYLIGSRTSATAEGVRTRDVVTGGRRKGASLGIERRMTDGISFGIGYRWARESAAPAGGGNPVPTPNETDAARARLTAQLNKRTSVFGEYENDLGAGNAKRFEVGGDIRVTDHLRAYGRHEFLNGFAGPYALDDRQGLNTTVLGFAADGRSDLSAFSEYRVRDAFAGRDAEAAMGLRNVLHISQAVRVSLSLERVTPTTGADAADGMTAVTSGLEWTGDPLTKGSLRFEYRTAQHQDQWLASGGLARKLGRDWTGLARTQWSWAPNRQQTVARDELAFALRETDVNRWNWLGRIEHRLDEQQLEPGLDSRHEVFLASTRLNVKASQPLTLMGRVAGKWTFDDAGGRTIDGRGALTSLRALYDLSPRLDLALAARARWDGAFDHRTDGLGAELGVLVTRNLRLSGGYNAFGFHDPDFASLERTDKGPFVAFGFKFDEGLFGGGSQKAAPSTAEVAPEGVQRGSIATAPKDTLSSDWERISDPAIAGDLRTIDGWRAKVDALPDSAGIYGRAKARAWLDLARAEYTDADRTGDPDKALANAVAIVHAMTATPADSAALLKATAAALPQADGAPTSDLLAEAAQLHAHEGFHCAEEEVAQLEVQLAWAANEARNQGSCKVTPHLDEAKHLAEVARAKAEACIKPVAVVEKEIPPPPVEPEVGQLLAEIPSGIHFALNKSDLSPTSKEVIGRIAVVLAKYPHIKVDLKGHTDSRGSAEYNLALSKRRADAVQAGLVAEGVDASRITTSFAGKGELLTEEKDTRDLALNRRVDFHYYDTTGAEIGVHKQVEDLQIEKTPVKKPAPKKPAAKKPAAAPKPSR